MHTSAHTCTPPHTPAHFHTPTQPAYTFTPLCTPPHTPAYLHTPALPVYTFPPLCTPPHTPAHPGIHLHTSVHTSTHLHIPVYTFTLPHTPTHLRTPARTYTVRTLVPTRMPVPAGPQPPGCAPTGEALQPRRPGGAAPRHWRHAQPHLRQRGEQAGPGGGERHLRAAADAARAGRRAAQERHRCLCRPRPRCLWPPCLLCLCARPPCPIAFFGSRDCPRGRSPVPRAVSPGAAAALGPCRSHSSCPQWTLS